MHPFDLLIDWAIGSLTPWSIDWLIGYQTLNRNERIKRNWKQKLHTLNASGRVEEDEWIPAMSADGRLEILFSKAIWMSATATDSNECGRHFLHHEASSSSSDKFWKKSQARLKTMRRKPVKSINFQSINHSKNQSINDLINRRPTSAEINTFLKHCTKSIDRSTELR